MRRDGIDLTSADETKLGSIPAPPRRAGPEALRIPACGEVLLSKLREVRGNGRGTLSLNQAKCIPEPVSGCRDCRQLPRRGWREDGIAGPSGGPQPVAALRYSYP